MPLFNDGTITTIEGLVVYDSAVLDVASTESIDLTGKLGLAKDEIGVQLSALGAELGNLVVTTPLRLWHAFQTLALVYEDACFRQRNDRYAGKRDEYRECARWAAEKLFRIGVGTTSDPVPQAEAPEVTLAAGALPAESYWVTVAWVNQRGEAGAAAPAVPIDVPGGGTLLVRALNPPANAAGWNVYVGTAAEALYQQNEAPLSAGASWQAGASLLTSGPRAADGQAPESFRILPRVLQRM